ncbi:MAG: SCO family protein [Sterolibacteriaceae bacterium]|nr:SCO family protein [Candidatus Methylophosphatis haderslevensis]
MRLLRIVLLAWLAVLAGGGCGERAVTFLSTDITGADFGKDFHLTDHNGKPRSLADFRGSVVAMFFGYTQCPDVCPTSMTAMAEVMKQLGADAKRVQVLFVTVDPERDTPPMLAQYVPQFHPSFLGLHGDLPATQQVAKDFKVFYEKHPGRTPTAYSIDHTAGTYVFDPQGRLRLFVKHGETPERVAQDIRRLLAGK